MLAERPGRKWAADNSGASPAGSIGNQSQPAVVASSDSSCWAGIVPLYPAADQGCCALQFKERVMSKFAERGSSSAAVWSLALALALASAGVLCGDEPKCKCQSEAAAQEYPLPL